KTLKMDEGLDAHEDVVRPLQIEHHRRDHNVADGIAATAETSLRLAPAAAAVRTLDQIVRYAVEGDAIDRLRVVGVEDIDHIRLRSVERSEYAPPGGTLVRAAEDGVSGNSHGVGGTGRSDGDRDHGQCSDSLVDGDPAPAAVGGCPDPL